MDAVAGFIIIQERIAEATSGGFPACQGQPDKDKDCTPSSFLGIPDASQMDENFVSEVYFSQKIRKKIQCLQIQTRPGGAQTQKT